MISRRDKLLNFPWQQQRFEQHKQKVRSAKPAIDMRTPPVYSHVVTKPKKVQSQRERFDMIEKENLRLLQKLGEIMKKNRIQNFWQEPRPGFLNREKIFETRPYSSLPKLVAIYGPQHDVQHKPNFSGTRLSRRCPTCSGMPEITELTIPEQRIPWAPPRISMNVTKKDCFVRKKCLHCGHPK